MTEKDRFVVVNEVENILPYRTKYIDALLDVNKSYPIHFDHTHVKAVGTAFETEDSLLIAIGHTNYREGAWINIHLHNLPERFKTANHYNHAYSSKYQGQYTIEPQVMTQTISLYFEASEFKLIEISL